MDELRIAFCQPAQDLRRLSDAAFLQALSWEPAARKSLVAAAEAGDCERFYRKLQHRGFGKRKAVLEAPALRPHAQAEETDRADELFTLLKNFAANKSVSRSTARLNKWLDRGSDGPLSVVEIQLLLELLLRAADRLPAELFARLWRIALTEAVELSAELDEAAGEPSADHRRLLLQGEIPWQAGLLFADVAGAEVLREFGRQHFADQLEEKTDTDGTPQAELAANVSTWLASFVRAIDWGKRFGDPLWGEQEANRFQQLVAMIVPTCRADGRLAFQNGQSDSAVPLLEAASKAAGWHKGSITRRYLRALGGGHAPARRKKKKTPGLGKGADRPVVQSDWARFATLRSNWQPVADMIVLAHHRDKPLVELSVAGRPLISGVWDIELSVDGDRLTFLEEWTCTCWHTDTDADYIEIQFSFEGGVQVERQVLLSRTDRYALLADAVSGAGTAQIDYTATLPVVHPERIEADVPTRECRVRRKGCPLRAFPLSLPDDRVQSAPGSFASTGEGLELKQTALGGLYAPIVLDWHPKRRRAEADWRTLTVSEAGEVQQTAAAGGYRLRVGNHQLLIYRSLKQPTVPRAVLGQHTDNETLIGRFDDAGDVAPILIVE